MTVDIIIYHNPECGTSRNTLAMIQNAGIEPRVIEYLKTPPNRSRLVSLITRMGITPRALLREKGTPYTELGLDDAALSDDQLVDAIAELFVHQPKVKGAGEDVVARIVGIVPEAEACAHVCPGPRHQLHEAHRAGRRPGRSAAHACAAPAFGLHHRLDPLDRHPEPGGCLGGIGSPVGHDFRAGGGSGDEAGRREDRSQRAHSSLALPTDIMFRGRTLQVNMCGQRPVSACNSSSMPIT